MNFVISFRGRGDVRDHLENPMIFEFRPFEDFPFFHKLASMLVEVGIDFRRGGNSVGKFAPRTFVITVRFAPIVIFSVNSLWFLSLVVLTFLALLLSCLDFRRG